jgi:U3 small nucleolar RNA-associated protein 24
MTRGNKVQRKKFAQTKRIIAPSDTRLKDTQQRRSNKEEEDRKKRLKEAPQVASSLFFHHNSALGPPYRLLLDTNFINFSVKNKLDIVKAAMDCLYADCTPCITDCVLGELEKLGQKYRLALKVARDTRFERLPCMHKGTYADDCIVQRVSLHRCFIVGTCDRGLKQRLRKIPGVPIMYISGHKYTVEQLPEAYGIMY